MRPSRLFKWLRARKLVKPVETWLTNTQRICGCTLVLDESAASPYLAERYQWYAFQATQLWAAYIVRGEQPPWPLSDDFEKDEYFLAERESSNGGAAVLFGPEMWLPVGLDRVVPVPWVTDPTRVVPTHSSMALSDLLARVLKAFPRVETRDEQMTNFFSAVGTLRELASFSTRKRVPLLLDY